MTTNNHDFCWLTAVGLYAYNWLVQ